MLKELLLYISDPKVRFAANSTRGFYNRLSDEEYLKKKYKLYMGKDLNLESPTTFNEKIQWCKLYDRREEYISLVDKSLVKDWASSIIGEDYIIRTLGVWDRFDDIDFEALPNQFVLKCTHDSGGLVICKDKRNLNINKAKIKIEKCLKRNYYWQGREWPYKYVKPRIIAEEYMEDSTFHELRDYKFFCFDGKVKALFIATERQSLSDDTKFDFFDENFNHLPITNGHPNASECPPKPVKFEEMKILASKLSKGIPHVRVDFYEVNGRVYFGEMTFSHWSGFVPFEPEKWDKIFGDWFTLPGGKNHGK